MEVLTLDTSNGAESGDASQMDSGVFAVVTFALGIGAIVSGLDGQTFIHAVGLAPVVGAVAGSFTAEVVESVR